ncbi:biopolymer transporter ExbD [bacterium]|nr:biopolymer transporter ExbD [bacterium]
MPFRREGTALEKSELTSMVDIIFQLMIFFLVSMSVMPSVKSAPQVEGTLNLAPPKQGGTEVSHVIQLHLNRNKEIEYYVLQGNDDSAEFFQKIANKRTIVMTPLLKTLGERYGVYFNLASLQIFLHEIRDSDPKILIRADRKLPYGQIVEITNYIHSLGITKYAWVGGTFLDLNAEIRKGRRS